MTFELVHQIQNTATPTSITGDLPAIREAFVDSVFDYLWDVFYPSIGYEVNDIASIPSIPAFWSTVTRFKEVVFPVINAANGLDYTMKSWQAWHPASSGRLAITSGLRGYTNADTYSGYGGVSYITDPGQTGSQVLYKPASIYRDTERPSDWFLILFDHVAVFYVKPRVRIDTWVDVYQTDPNYNYSTQIGFFGDFNYTYGGNANVWPQQSFDVLKTAVPTSGYAPTGPSFFTNLALNRSQEPYEQMPLASLNSRNFGVYAPIDRLGSSNMFSSEPWGDVFKRGTGDGIFYYRLQDSTGNWWLLTQDPTETTSSKTTFAFNCGLTKPV